MIRSIKIRSDSPCFRFVAIVLGVLAIVAVGTPLLENAGAAAIRNLAVVSAFRGLNCQSDWICVAKSQVDATLLKAVAQVSPIGSETWQTLSNVATAQHDFLPARVAFVRVILSAARRTGFGVIRTSEKDRLAEKLAKYQVGQRYAANGDLPAALAPWREIGLARSLASSFYLEAKQALQTGDRSGWEQKMRLAILADPTFVDAYYGLADVYLASSQTEKLIETIRQLLLADNQPSARRSFWQGQLYLQQDDPKMACRFFAEASESQPDYGVAHFFLGYCNYLQGNNEEAIVNYLQAMKADPGLVWSYYWLAVIYVQREDYKQANDYLERALQLEPANAQLQRLKSKIDGVLK